jgi:hypothetical protein
MKKIYFDYNVISYLRSGRDKLLNKKYESIAADNMVVFSPAHLEDIAASAMRDNTEKRIIVEEIEFLSMIAQRNALRPVTRDQVVMYDESPQDCYERVIKNYAKNDRAEEIDAAIILDANINPAGNPREMNNIELQEILNRLAYRELIAVWLSSQGIINSDERIASLSWRFSDIKNRFSVFECYVNLAANILEKIGYHREKEDKSRSRLHDVSHIIYGAYSDIFVSADKKMIPKAKAIYSMLEVPTKVISLSEFYEL